MKISKCRTARQSWRAEFANRKTSKEIVERIDSTPPCTVPFWSKRRLQRMVQEATVGTPNAQFLVPYNLGWGGPWTADASVGGRADIEPGKSYLTLARRTAGWLRAITNSPDEYRLVVRLLQRTVSVAGVNSPHTTLDTYRMVGRFSSPGKLNRWLRHVIRRADAILNAYGLRVSWNAIADVVCRGDRRPGKAAIRAAAETVRARFEKITGTQLPHSLKPWEVLAALRDFQEIANPELFGWNRPVGYSAEDDQGRAVARQAARAAWDDAISQGVEAARAAEIAGEAAESAKEAHERLPHVYLTRQLREAQAPDLVLATILADAIEESNCWPSADCLRIASCAAYQQRTDGRWGIHRAGEVPLPWHLTKRMNQSDVVYGDNYQIQSVWFPTWGTLVLAVAGAIATTNGDPASWLPK